MAALLVLAACRRESAPQKQGVSESAVRYGEPIGIQVKGPGIPALLAAIAVTEKRSPDAFVNELASQLYAAIVRCPVARDQLTAQKPVVLRLMTHDDDFALASAESEPAAKCVGEALVGKALPGAQNLRLMVELRLDPSSP